jgi:hypothetical protein
MPTIAANRRHGFAPQAERFARVLRFRSI